MTVTTQNHVIRRDGVRVGATPCLPLGRSKSHAARTLMDFWSCDPLLKKLGRPCSRTMNGKLTLVYGERINCKRDSHYSKALWCMATIWMPWKYTNQPNTLKQPLYYWCSISCSRRQTTNLPFHTRRKLFSVGSGGGGWTIWGFIWVHMVILKLQFNV